MMTAPAGSQLQSTLAAGSATAVVYAGHHPLTCAETLAYGDDGALACPHGRTEPADTRTQMAVDQSVAYLLLEMIHERDLG